MTTTRVGRRTRKLERQFVETVQRNSIRRQSRQKLFGFPLYDIAFGPDLEAGELRGHAKGIVAIGDVATGAVAIGGLATGCVAIGGLACGLLSIGGCAFGLLGAIGGVAVGGVALGGVAIALKSYGGAVVDPGWIE